MKNSLTGIVVGGKIDKAVNKLMWHKSIGINKILHSMIKYLDEDNRNMLFNLIRE